MLPSWLKDHKFYKRLMDTNSDGIPEENDLTSENEVSQEEANCISSNYRDPWADGADDLHRVFLDIDVNHIYIPSSTPGHGHLILDVPIGRPQLQKVMDVLAEYQIVNHGWAEQVRVRGANTLRLPGVEK